MAKVIGPDFVALHVRDLAASQHFYADLLGLELDPKFTSPTFVTFATKPIPFGIREPAPGVDLGTLDQLGAGVDLWLNCDDVDGLYASLEANGVPILQQPADTPFGRRFICRDPNGYALIIYKAIPLDQVQLKP
jgi:predicted enzyme related to lactoylglutathione lyase